MIALGQKYRDEVTGFEGVATARYEYLNGCIRFLLEAPHTKEGKAVSEVFDEERLIEVANGEKPGDLESSSGGLRDDPHAVR